MSPAISGPPFFDFQSACPWRNCHPGFEIFTGASRSGVRQPARLASTAMIPKGSRRARRRAPACGLKISPAGPADAGSRIELARLFIKVLPANLGQEPRSVESFPLAAGWERKRAARLGAFFEHFFRRLLLNFPARQGLETYYKFVIDLAWKSTLQTFRKEIIPTPTPGIEWSEEHDQS